MTKANIVDYFICPSCEHEEEFARGEKPDQCPNCGLVIAKWEEKMREEAEKEKIRRRLLRDQRLKGDRDAELAAKQAELDRLKALELEIMKELGIRPPSRLWQLFEKYTISMGFAFSASIVMATGVAFYHVDKYLEEQEKIALEETEASPEMQQVAPVMAAAIEMQQQGKTAMIQDMADINQMMAGGSNETRDAIIAASQQMMKGVDQEAFLKAAGNMAMQKGMAQLSDGEIEPAPVNLDTIGGVSGLQGVTNFAPSDLAAMAPALTEHGHEKVLEVMSEKTFIADPINPEGPELIVERIDEMDGSMIFDLMSTISTDQEWDQYLLSHVKEYVMNDDLERADDLSNRIKNPVVRIQALSVLMQDLLMDENIADMKVVSARVRLELDKIDDPDARAKVILEMGEDLAAAGSSSEPYDSIETVSIMAGDADSAFEESYLTSRLAVSYMKINDLDTAKRMLKKSMRLAGQLPELSLRISAFTRLAQRYYDVRNVTIANEILAEAARIAGTDLQQHQRSVAFGEIAVAHAYMGDTVGAEMAIANAGEGKGKQQLIAKVAESLIGHGRYYEALSWMESLEDETQYARLELRLSSALYYENRHQEALTRVEQSAARVSRIFELAERGLLTSQFARMFTRFGLTQRGEELFSEAEAISQSLTGRKSQVVLALVALDRARVFQLTRAKDMVTNDLTDTVVRDPIDSEIMATERITRDLLPPGLEAVEER